MSRLENRNGRFCQCILLLPPNSTLLSNAISIAETFPFLMFLSFSTGMERLFLLLFDYCESTFGLCLCIE